MDQYPNVKEVLRGGSFYILCNGKDLNSIYPKLKVPEDHTFEWTPLNGWKDLTIGVYFKDMK